MKVLGLLTDMFAALEVAVTEVISDLVLALALALTYDNKFPLDLPDK
jgi:hypothetical protein